MAKGQGGKAPAPVSQPIDKNSGSSTSKGGVVFGVTPAGKRGTGKGAK